MKEIKKDEQIAFLQKLDMFGIGINIKINQREKHQTRIGGCVSIGLFMLMLFFSSNLLSQIFMRSNPQLLFQQKQISQPKRYDLSADKFSIAFALLNSTLEPFIDQTIYSISAQVYHKIRTINGANSSSTDNFESIDIEMEPCTESNFQEPQTRQYFLNLNYENMYCIKKGQSNLYIEGQFDSEEFNMIRIDIKDCISSPQIVCKDLEQRKAVLQKTNLQVYYVNSVIQVTNIEEPFQKVGQTQFWNTNYEMMQQVNLMFINTFMDDDFGLFYSEDILQRTDLTFSSERLLFGSRDPSEGDNFYRIELFMEKNKENSYQRSYMRIPQAISQIGGIFNVFFAIGCLLSKPYANLQLQRKIINQTFSLDGVDKKQTNSKDKPQQQGIEKSNQKQENNIDIYKSNKNRSNQDTFKLDIISKKRSVKSSIQNIQANSNSKVNGTQERTKIDHLQKSEIQEQPPVKRSEDIQIEQQLGDYNQSYSFNKMQGLFNKTIVQQSKFDSHQEQQYNEKKDNNNSDQKSQTKLFPLDEAIKQQDNSCQEEGLKKQNLMIELLNFVKVGTVEYLKSFLSYLPYQKDDKLDVIQYCQKKLNQFTDICYLINKQIEQQHMKYLIFNADQLNIFELIPKPHIDDKLGKRQSLACLFYDCQYGIGNNQQNTVLLKQNSIHTQNLQVAKAAYRNIKSKTTQSNNINYKLLQMLDSKQIQMLESNQNSDNQEKHKIITNSISLLNQKSTINKQNQKIEDSQSFSVKQEIQSNDASQNAIKQTPYQTLRLFKSLSQDSLQIIDLHEEKCLPQKVYQQKQVNIIPHHIIPSSFNKSNNQNLTQIECGEISSILDEEQNYLSKSQINFE